MGLSSDKRRLAIEALREVLQAKEPARLYAVVDAARGPMTIPPTLQAMTDQISCLYRGQALEEFGDDTAWVVGIAPDESVLDWLIDNGFGKRWSIFLRSTLQLADVVRHLRKFTVIEDEEGTAHFFRFYDPRTLRQYLPVFTPEQNTAFFTGVDAWFCENDLRPDELLKFTANTGTLHREVISLASTQDAKGADDEFERIAL